MMVEHHPDDSLLAGFAAGTLDHGESGSIEDPETASRRELEEETGYRAGSWRLLGRFWPAPGFAPELMHLYLATELTVAGDDRRLPEADERLHLVRMPWRDALTAAERGEIADAKSYLTGVFPLRLETQEGLTDQLVQIKMLNLPDNYLENYRDNVQAVTGEEILRVAQKYVKPDEAALIVVGVLMVSVLSEGDRGAPQGTTLRRRAIDFRNLDEALPVVLTMLVMPLTFSITNGIGAGFVPDILDTSLIDEVVRIGNDTAFALAREAASLEGLPAGISSGAALAAAYSVSLTSTNPNSRGGQKHWLSRENRRARARGVTPWRASALPPRRGGGPPPRGSG